MFAKAFVFVATGSLLCAPLAHSSDASQRALFADPSGRSAVGQIQRSPGPGGQTYRPGEAGGRPTDIRKRRVKVDASAITGTGLPDGGESIGLNLFPDVDLTAVKQRFERRGPGRSTWVGKVAGDPAGSVILAEVEGLVAGSIYAHGKHYSIRGADAESQEIVEVDQSAFAPEACDQPPAADQVQGPSAPQATQGAQPDSSAKIDVMVVYTPAAMARQGGSAAAMETLSQLAVDETNAAYANSGIATSLNLVHVAQVAYTETKSSTGYQTDLARLRSPGDGFMDGVHTLRDDHHADVVVLLVDAAGNYPAVCGYGYIAATESYAFALVGENCATINLTFGHEIGHIQGARHDWYVDPTDNSPFTYNHGHVDTGIRRRTIMAYNNQCAATPPGTYCDRVRYFSNPAVNYPGYTDHPMGSLVEDNTRTLNTTALDVANFRQDWVTLTVQSTYPTVGASITTAPASSNGTTSGATPMTLTYDRGATVTLTAPALDPVYGLYPLLGWSGCTSVSDPVPNVCTVAMDADRSVTANYATPNLLPTLDAISDLTIPEDAGQQTLSLTGISTGDGESQTVIVSAVSSNEALIPNDLDHLEVSYTNWDPEGSLRFTPIADASGTATITVTVDDGQAAYNTTVRTFLVTVSPVNDPPALDTIPDLALDEDAPTQTVPLTGISAGGGESQTVTMTAVSSNTALIQTPTVTYGGGSEGSLSFAPVADRSGSATITVTLYDGQATSGTTVRTFLVTVSAVNDPPTLNAILPPFGVKTIAEDASWQSVSLGGISAGGGESQTLTVTAVSDAPAIIPNDIDHLKVSYASPGATGSLSFKPRPNAFGSTTITVSVVDGGGATNIPARTFQVSVNPGNDPPTLDPIAAKAITRNADLQTVDLTGITAGPGGESQALTVTASSSNTALIPNPAVSYTSPNSTGILSFTPVAGKYGAATITVRVNDGQLTGGSLTRTFTVTVNDPPTLDAIDDRTLNEDAGQQTVALGGIKASADGAERQALSVSAISSNTALIPNPTVSYGSPNATGTLRFTPVANASGTATITVTVKDGQAANNIVQQTFTVTVDPVNDAPTLNAIASRTINEDAPLQTVSLGGITAGPKETQDLLVTAISSNPTLIPDPAVSYASPNSTGTLTFTPTANVFGTATITVTVDDGQLVNNLRARTFLVTVRSVNDRPTLLDPPDMALDEDAGQQTVPLAGVTAGGGEAQTLKVTASSSNTALVPTPTVTYRSPDATGSLRFTPAANTSGTATITVMVSDGQTTNGTVVQSFLVTVNPVNDLPALNAITDRVLRQSAGQQTVSLGGIAAGPKESQKLTATASSSNTGLIPNPTVTYTSPNTTGSLRFTPVAHAYGSATITVTVDDGQTANNTFSRSFIVTVNDPPTLATIANRTIPEDAGQQTVDLTGISAGSGESQTLTVTATSSNASLIPNPTVSYASPSEIGTLRFAPTANKSGSATISVIVDDLQAGNNSLTRSFVVTVQAVNDDPPTLDAIPDLVLAKNAGQQNVPLSGITAGPGERQPLTVTATSSNTGLIPNPAVSYTTPAGTGSLRFTPVAGAAGSARMAVTVRDSQATNNSVTQYFDVTVSVGASFVGIVGGVPHDNPSGPAPLAVTFDAGDSRGPNPIVAYRWDFGDGQTDETVTDTVAHDYTATGSYFVTLTVTDSLGETDSTQRLVSVAEEIMTAATAAELQAALTAAAADEKDDVIRLAGGVYALSANESGHFAYSSAESGDLVIEGGWTPEFNQRALNVPTRLLNDFAAPVAGPGGVLSIVAAGGVRLDGLDLSGGSATGHGGGLYVLTSGPIAVADCRILDSTAGGDGGGAHLESTGGAALLSGNVIHGNSGSSGGGVVIRAVSVSAYANEISGNSADVAEGGLQASISSGGDLIVSNNTIFGNQAAAGASGLSVAAEGVGGISLLDVRNNIVYGNGTAPNFIVAADCEYIASHLNLNIVSNDIETCTTLCLTYTLDPSNIAVDFSGRAAGSIRISETTDPALIDQGAASGVPPTDFEGDAVPLDGDGDGTAAPDIGADEYNPGNVPGPGTLTVAVKGGISLTGGSAAVTVTLDRPAKRHLLFHLAGSDSTVVTVPAPYIKVLRGQSVGQTYIHATPATPGGSVTLTVTDPSGHIAPGYAPATVTGN